MLTHNSTNSNRARGLRTRVVSAAYLDIPQVVEDAPAAVSLQEVCVGLPTDACVHLVSSNRLATLAQLILPIDKLCSLLKDDLGQIRQHVASTTCSQVHA